VVAYQHFRGPSCLPLQGEVAGVEDNGIDIDPDRRGVAGVTNQ